MQSLDSSKCAKASSIVTAPGKKVNRVYEEVFIEAKQKEEHEPPPDIVWKGGILTLDHGSRFDLDYRSKFRLLREFADSKLFYMPMNKTIGSREVLFMRVPNTARTAVAWFVICGRVPNLRCSIYSRCRDSKRLPSTTLAEDWSGRRLQKSISSE